MSASACFDLFYGYRNRAHGDDGRRRSRRPSQSSRAPPRRVRDAGCDGVEITASKGYLIHQFLNPATNRRSDALRRLGRQKRFQFLEEIVTAVRQEVGAGLPVRRPAVGPGLQLPADQHPLAAGLPLRDYFGGNDLPETPSTRRELEELGVDYLHIDSGFGFINPKGSPGEFPIDELPDVRQRHAPSQRQGAGARRCAENASAPALSPGCSGGGAGATRRVSNAADARAFKRCRRSAP